MIRYLIAGCFILATLLIAYIGCGPRGQVVADKILKKIDQLIDELDVELKKVENKKTELTRATDEVKKSLYETEARVALMQEQQSERRKDEKALNTKLSKCVELLKSNSESPEVVIEGKTVSKEELMTFANDTADALELVKSRIASKEKIIQLYQNNLTMYRNQVEVSTKSLAKLDDQIDSIKVKMEALDDQQKAALIDGKSVSLNDEFEALTKDVDDLLVSVDANLRLETEKLNKRIADSSANSGISSELDDLISGKENEAKSLSRFEALLGGADTNDQK